MRVSLERQAERHLHDPKRRLSYAEHSYSGTVVIMSVRDFKSMERSVERIDRLLPFLGRWGA